MDPDDNQRFGLEVTGLNEAIKKKSNKLIQMAQFEQGRGPNEKGILLANTHNQTRVSERPQVNFTQDAAQFLSAQPVLLMTGYDMFRLVCDVVANRKKADDVVTLLKTETGVFSYA